MYIKIVLFIYFFLNHIDKSDVRNRTSDNLSVLCLLLRMVEIVMISSVATSQSGRHPV